MPITKISTLPDVADYDIRSTNIPEEEDIFQISISDNDDFNSAKVEYGVIKDDIQANLLAQIASLSAEIDSIKWDTETVALTSHDDYSLTISRGSNGTSTRTWDISKFRGDGLSNDDIRVLHVQYRVSGDFYSNFDHIYMYATYPDGSSYRIVDLRKVGGLNDTEGIQGSTVAIPVNKDQDEITVTIELDNYTVYGLYAEVTFRHASQNVKV